MTRRLADQRQIPSAVDNAFLPPALRRPLEGQGLTARRSTPWVTNSAALLAAGASENVS
jgi:hypothetical protein